MTQVLGYCRVSGQGQIEGDGITRQRLSMMQYALEHDLEVVEVFEELGVSGTKDLEYRPALQALYARLQSSGITKIIVEKLDRVARDLMIQETILGDLGRRGIELISVAEPDLCSSDPSRVLIRQIFGALAQWDRAMITLKLSGAKTRIRAAGGKAEGQYAFGKDPKRPEEADGLDRIRRGRTLGFTTDKIANILNDIQIPTRSGKPWRGTTVAKILARG